MIRKRFGYDDREYTHRYIDEVKRIQDAIYENGYEADLKDCADIWDDYSDSLAAGWIGVPKDYEEIWRIVGSEVRKIPND